MAINLAVNYTSLLDEKYKRESVTSILDTPSELVRWTNANTIEIANMDIDGLGNYARNGGYVAGSESISWTPYALSYDRARSFNVDIMDDEETVGVAFGQLAGQFMKQRVVPEVDAIRFAKLAGTANILSANGDITVGTTNCLDLVDAADAAQNDAEVSREGKILFCSNTFYRGIKSEIDRQWVNENGIDREVFTLDGIRVIVVPKARFNTAITLNDGTTSGQTGGGYKAPASTSYPINFMLVDPQAIMQVAKHEKVRVFSPDENQSANAYKFDYRIYHDTFVYANKAKGIYMHRASTANAADISG